jgi:hypothetical protein
VDALCADEPFRFGEFVRGYTRLLSRRLLEDEVFSLGLAWLPARGALLEVATFGMPPILVGGPGQSIRKLGSNNPPLSAYTEEVRTTAHELCSARSLLFYTDGLSEAETASGELYREYLDADFLGSGSGNQLLQAYRARVAEPADDATFLLLRRVDAAASWQDTLVVQSRLDLVEQACLDLEHRLAICTRLEAGPRSEFSVAIREALLNAYEHGSLEISGALKRHLLACETAVDRLITVHISVQAEAGNHLVQVVIQDEGQGFVPPPPWFDDRDGLTVCGRGLKMVKKYTDAFHFNAQGNAITLMKIYHGGSDAADTNGPH